MLRIVGSLLFLLSSASAGNWEECRSGPFQVWTNGSERDARQLLVRLEQVRHVLGHLLGKPDPGALWTLRVIVAKGKQATPWTLGHDAWVSILPAGAAPPRAWQKEVARMLLESNARRMPAYWEDGLIDFFSTLEAQGPKITLGAPPPPAERNLNWARVHFLATNVEYVSRFRVLLNNLQGGADEDVAYRNSLGMSKTALEADIAKHFAAGQFSPTTVAGRAMAEKDFTMRPLEASRVAAAIGEAAGNPKLAAEGSLESAELQGLDAARRGQKQEARDLLKQAIEAGSRSARVHLEYGKLLGDSKARQDAYVEAAKRNPRWAQPYIELAEMETTPSRHVFYLKTAAALDHRNSELWQRLARAYLNAKQFSEASKAWFSAELAAPTAEDRAKVAEARRLFEDERQNREASERKRIADERQQELDRLKAEAMNAIKAAEARANQGLAPADPKKKVEEWWDEKTPSQKVSGQFQKVDCLGKQARIWILPAGGKATALLIRDPGQIVVMGGGETAFGCGPQRPVRQVTVEYKPRVDTKLGTSGDVAFVEFR
ncbi:MAG TPA: hypothetical protein VM120_10930 [Bryobacteraceae bacterium]|nr:hypothetical protein [Bryobacteraceae bacterium]